MLDSSLFDALQKTNAPNLQIFWIWCPCTRVQQIIFY